VDVRLNVIFRADTASQVGSPVRSDSVSTGTFEAGVFNYGDLVSHYIGTGDWTRFVDTESMVSWLYSSSQKKTMIT
jgi:hypothetical protein